MTGALTREWVAPFPVDVHLTLSPHGRGTSDPTYRVDSAGAVWRTSLTPDGPGTIRVLPAAPDDRVIACAWGPGGSWLLGTLPAALGTFDDISGFDPTGHPVLHQVAKRHPGFRVGRTGRLMEALVPAILEQKVVSLEAHRAWVILLTKYGSVPPGPVPEGMRVFPPPKVWRSIPSWDWHRAGVEAVRARTIMGAASAASSLERLLDAVGPSAASNVASAGEAGRRLCTLPGIGPWTAAETLQRAAGDPDAVSVGDYNLPKAVGYALAGRQATDDEQMLQLLEPYRGHRHRVAQLVGLSGLRPPRRGPRMTVRDYRSF